YALDDLVIWDNLLFRVRTAIPTAPAVPDFTTIEVKGAPQSDYWKGSPTMTDWVVGNWVTICTVPSYGNYRVVLDCYGNSVDGSLLFEVTTTYNGGALTLVSYSRNPSASLWGRFELRGTGNNPVRLEGRINNATAPSFKVILMGAAEHTDSNSSSIPK